jgi:tetratricopeptide (TPR) repeat protein
MELQAVVNPGNPSASRRREILLAAAIVAITLLTYLPTMWNGFIWDDDEYVTNNSLLRTPNGLRRIWLDRRSTPQYYPLVFTTFRIEHSLWGNDPAGYHVVNILLHAANALLLWRILVFLGVPGGWLAGLIFAVHPAHIESVAWVTERKNVLSGFFYLAALWTALKFYLGEESGRRRWTAYGGALLLFVCALLSKTVTCSLPAAVALVLWWKRGRVSRREALTLLPFLALGAALALNTARLENTSIGAAGSDWNFSIVQRCLIAGRAPWFYLSKLAWPEPLIFIYPRWTVDSAAAWQYLFPAATVAALAALWLLRGRIGRGPFAAAGFFVVSLAPALGFFNVYFMRYSLVADHWQYLAMIGVVALAAGLLAWVMERRGAQRTAAMAVAGALVLACGALTFRQTLIYHDEETLWRDTLAKNPKAWIAHTNLAGLLIKKAMAPGADSASFLDEAGRRCEEAMRDMDEAHVPKPCYAQVYVNRGLIHTVAQRYAEAIREYDQAIALNPNYPEAWFNRGTAYAIAGRLEEALSDLNQAIALKPYYPEAYCNRGNVHADAQRYAEAIRDYDRAIACDPSYADAWYNRANVFAAADRPAEAIRDFSRVIELRPRDAAAYYNRAIARKRMKQDSEALADLLMARKLGGTVPEELLRSLGSSAQPPR